MYKPQQIRTKAPKGFKQRQDEAQLNAFHYPYLARLGQGGAGGLNTQACFLQNVRRCGIRNPETRR